VGKVIKAIAKPSVALGVPGMALNKLTGGKLDKNPFGLLMGEKSAATPNEVIDMASPQGRAFQEQALGQYGKFLGEDVSGLARAQSANLENMARSGAADQEMRARQMVAQRGLGGTSLGLNAILGQSAQLGNQIGAIRAQSPELERQMRQQNLNFATGGINQILGEQGQSRVLKMGQAAGPRTGGLAPLIGAGLGGLLGGPAGAGIGMSAGQYATQMG